MRNNAGFVLLMAARRSWNAASGWAFRATSIIIVVLDP
jgi:hypothetical protein